MNICNNCFSPVMDESQYCHKCGSLLNCKSCNNHLVKDAKFCSFCGEAVNTLKEKDNGINTLKYRKTNDEVFCEVSLTDAVAKDGITTLIRNITSSEIYPTLKIEDNQITATGIQENHYPSVSENVLDVSEKETQNNKFDYSNNIQNFPHIDDLVIHFQYSEKEWLAIFAFYEAGYGQQPFSQEKVKNAYYRLRKTDSRVSNFNANWKTFFKEYASTISSGVFKLRADKIDSIIRMTQGSNSQFEGVSNKPKNVSSQKTKGSKSSKASAKAVPVDEFNIDAGQNKKSLENFYQIKNPQTTPEKILVISYYVTKFNKNEYFTDGNIEFAYKVLGLGRINHLRQSITNAKNKYSWFKMTDEGWIIERLGEIYVDKM